MIRVQGRVFFDSPAVTNRVDKGTRRVLSRFGAFVRATARRSIRKRKRVSEPGQPPSSHTGLLKRFIFFSYEPQSKNVVIGPERLRRVGNAPEALEHGGESAAFVRRRGRRRRVTFDVAARPFMGPAFQKEEPKLPAMWRDSIKA